MQFSYRGGTSAEHPYRPEDTSPTSASRAAASASCSTVAVRPPRRGRRRHRPLARRPRVAQRARQRTGSLRSALAAHRHLDHPGHTASRHRRGHRRRVAAVHDVRPAIRVGGRVAGAATASIPTGGRSSQMAETSDFIRDLNRRPLPKGPARRVDRGRGAIWSCRRRGSRLRGAENVVVGAAAGAGNDHSVLPGSPNAASARWPSLWPAARPTCQSGPTCAADELSGQLIDTAERAAGGRRGASRGTAMSRPVGSPRWRSSWRSCSPRACNRRHRGWRSPRRGRGRRPSPRMSACRRPRRGVVAATYGHSVLVAVDAGTGRLRWRAQRIGLRDVAPHASPAIGCWLPPTRGRWPSAYVDGRVLWDTNLGDAAVDVHRSSTAWCVVTTWEGRLVAPRVGGAGGRICPGRAWVRPPRPGERRGALLGQRAFSPSRRPPARSLALAFHEFEHQRTGAPVTSWTRVGRGRRRRRPPRRTRIDLVLGAGALVAPMRGAGSPEAPPGSGRRWHVAVADRWAG